MNVILSNIRNVLRGNICLHLKRHKKPYCFSLVKSITLWAFRSWQAISMPSESAEVAELLYKTYMILPLRKNKHNPFWNPDWTISIANMLIYYFWHSWVWGTSWAIQSGPAFIMKSIPSIKENKQTWYLRLTWFLSFGGQQIVYFFSKLISFQGKMIYLCPVLLGIFTGQKVD